MVKKRQKMAKNARKWLKTPEMVKNARKWFKTPENG